ncbi:cytochrome c biogenesis protein [Botrimarina hoheduenensis]|uniref:Cytochrome c biogenesis protein CcsA n=1 Tax=Botrimarina hoheduenensis TaxID=2528000 RepID=A0A5C5VZM3_9BACT|nr:cytochrome c biogenesis protein CcsA [Botrimarina hoheduenensis]TWT42932.1 Cytochrome c biogenesis protein CcsA [Botrimarina hoheduenensis]
MPSLVDTPLPPQRSATPTAAKPGWWRAIEALASLKLTVVLFALAIFLVFVGTLAQVDHDIWYVVDHTYFRVFWAQVEWQALARFVELFSRAEPRPISGGFWFPGGLLIGGVMMVNLTAAHALRFKVAAKGQRLAGGLALIALGMAATAWVVVSGMDDAFASQLSPALCETLWQTLRGALAVLALGGTYWSVQSYQRVRPAEWWLAAATNLGLLLASGWLLSNPQWRLDDAGLRILWQLAKGGLAATVLLAGCWLVFRKRAGIVLLHAGIGLLMFGELLTGLTADEAQMRLSEGQTVNYAYDIRSTELAIVTPDGDADRVTVIPEQRLALAARTGRPIEHSNLPFTVRVVRFDGNSTLKQPLPNSENLATRGAGQTVLALPSASVVGVGPDQTVNLPSAYVELLSKASGESLGVWLVSSSMLEGPQGGQLLPQSVETEGVTHAIELRFERHYKPYSVTLEDFTTEYYVGTQTPKNYESNILLRDPAENVDRRVRIWMNNPLRYSGDTLYQSGFIDEQTTILQVTSNGGWMIPYVSCMLVGVGMLAHFGVTLSRFLRRRTEEAERRPPPQAGAATAGALAENGGWRALLRLATWRSPLVWAPALVALVIGGYLASKARPARDVPGQFAVQRFGRTPLADDGRVKPLDTLARITLQYLSGKQEAPSRPGSDEPTSAIVWLLDCLTDPNKARDYRVFRIDNLELLDTLGLERRTGSYRYSLGEILKNDERFRKQVALANEKPKKSRSLTENRTLELNEKLMRMSLLMGAFSSPRISIDPERMQETLAITQQQISRLRSAPVPRIAPPVEPSGEWSTLFEAEYLDLLAQARRSERNPATVALAGVLDAYANEDPAAFAARLAALEAAVGKYEARLAEDNSAGGLAPAERLSLGKIAFEQFFNEFSPFYYCAVCYLMAFLMVATSWVPPPGSTLARSLGRCATSAIAVTLLVHTFALVARVYISGRPPVTTLYSSAVFIGWAAALFGLAFEAIYRLGIGALVSSVLGFLTLLVAYFLSLDGDTFTVLQAVLDTQFWLATHVVCVTLGYSTTYLAGFLAAVYLLGATLLNRFDQHARDQLVRMTYGTLCFALFFSFIGTVLGGLWADDSWGRFWGWDPKENGALIIVLWNALVLHARWGKLVGPVGLCVLTVAGNIVTSWSWFGVNELGVGLHSYGFTNGVSFWLLMFALSQLAVMTIGLIPFLKRTARA